jgi:hypothetical protein
MMNAEIELYEALVDAGVSKDKARNVVLAQKDTVDQFLTTLATKTDLAEFRTYVDGRFNLTKTDLTEFRAYVDGRFGLIKTDLAEFRAYVDGRFDLIKTDLTEFRAYVDGRFDLMKTDLQSGLTELRTYVDGRFNLVGEQMASMTNRIVIRLGALMVALTGLLGAVLTLTHR